MILEIAMMIPYFFLLAGAGACLLFTIAELAVIPDGSAHVQQYTRKCKGICQRIGNSLDPPREKYCLATFGPIARVQDIPDSFTRTQQRACA